MGKKEWLRDRLYGYLGEHIMEKRIRNVNEAALGLEEKKRRDDSKKF